MIVKKRMYLLVLIMICLSLLITSSAIVLMYQNTKHTVEMELTELLQSEASLIDVLYQENPDEQFVIRLLTQRQDNYDSLFNGQLEIAIAKKQNDSILFLTNKISNQGIINNRLLFTTNFAEPMKLALMGNSGFTEGLDYKGNRVFASYLYIEKLDWGLVSKVDVAVIRKPFYVTGLVTFLVSLLFSTIGVFFFYRISNPLIKQLSDREQQYKVLFEENQSQKDFLNTVINSVSNPMFVFDVTTNSILLSNTAGLEYEKKHQRCYISAERTDPPCNIEHCYCPIIDVKISKQPIKVSHIRYDENSTIPHYYEVSAFPIFDKSGEVVQLVEYLEDVTERRVVENQYVKLYRAVERSSASIVITNKEGTIEYVNPSFTKLTGYSFEEAIGQNPRILNSGKMDSAFYAQMWQTLVAGNEWRGELYNKRKDGSFFWEFGSISGIKDDNGEITHYVAVKENIDDRKKSEAEIKQNELRLRSIVDIIQSNPNTVQELLISALEEVIKITESKIGYIYFYDEEKKEFTLNSWSNGVMDVCSIMDPNTIYHLDKTGVWGEAVRQRKPIVINDFHAANPQKKGYPEGHAPLDSFLTVPIFSHGKIVAVVGVANKLTDYTETDVLQLTLMVDSVWKVVEQKQFENELKIKNQELLELNATKDKFFSIISHDLRNPFHVILGSSDLLVNRVESLDKEDIAQFATMINDSAGLAYKLLENLLDWSRIQRGMITADMKVYNLNSIVKEVVKLSEDMALRKNIDLQYVVDETVLVRCDSQMTTTILRNLISNAIKFTEKGGSIRVESLLIEDRVQINVIDSGVGIAAEKIPQLFKIETNVRSSGTADEQGTGLGLLLCKEFVEKQGGKIWVESEEGKGSVFAFILGID